MIQAVPFRHYLNPLPPAAICQDRFLLVEAQLELVPTGDLLFAGALTVACLQPSYAILSPSDQTDPRSFEELLEALLRQHIRIDSLVIVIRIAGMSSRAWSIDFQTILPDSPALPARTLVVLRRAFLRSGERG
jgi:hypothetical protein